MAERDEEVLTDAELDELARLSGDDVILVGDPREEDMYVTRDSGPASPADLDFITAARNYVPRLVAELRRLRERL